MNIPAPQPHSINPEDAACLSLQPGLESISTELTQVRDTIVQQLVTPKESINTLLDHVTKTWGKMLRPALVLLAGKCCGSLTRSHIEIAAMVEMTHVATLLHDDVIDEAQSRRRQITVNLLWGNESAVLLGDFLLGKVFAMAAGLEDRRVASVLAETAIEICQGELTQDLQCGNLELSEDEYIDIIAGKTAALFRSCCYLGAITAGAEPALAKAMADYGTYTGMAFQITDDLLDIMGNEAAEGKTLGKDVDRCKLTLPVIHLLGVLPPDEKQLICKHISSGQTPPELAQLIKKMGSCQYAKKKTQHYCNKAVEAIDLLNDTDAKTQLTNIVTYIPNRL